MAESFLLFPVGSSGDVNPFLGLALELTRRGHDVELVLNEHFAPWAERLGLRHRVVGSAQDYREALEHPDLWNARKGPRVVLGHPSVNSVVRRHFELTREFWRDHPRGVAVGATMAFGSLIAREVAQREGRDAKLATVHLQPFSIWSVEQPIVTPMGRVPDWLPRWVVRTMFTVADRVAFRPLLRDSVFAFRRELQLPAVRDWTIRWMNSPDLILGAFPDWYARPNDWPAQFVATDFFDCDGVPDDLDDELRAWVAAGPAPVVCTLGTAMKQGAAKFAAVIQGAERIGARLLILTPFADQIPRSLPPNVRRVDYAPLARVLPSAAAVIHHGGIGTTARALTAGIPQCIVPFGFDQFDNGDRIQRRGCGVMIHATRLSSRNSATAIERLLNDATMKTKASETSTLCSSDGLRRACEHLEALAAR